MAFTKFTIKNFKCFREEQVIIFGVPEEGVIGSGITYIVGANNSGKTTIIEGLSIRNAHKLKNSERVEGLDPEFHLYEGETLRRKCSLVRPESYTIVESPQLGDEEKFEIISSRRHWDSQANSNFSSLGQSLGNAYRFNGRQNNIEVASELRIIEADTQKYDEFISLVKRVIPEFTKFAVGYEDNEYIEYISGNGARHKTDLLGDGVITVIRILLQLYISKPGALIIDEPELSLHPAAQKKLLEVIAEYSEKRQIIISTHSPYFIQWNFLKNGAVVNRVVKQEDRESLIYSISDFSQYETIISGQNWQQPYLLDEVAKEIFFSEDHILFLEGQEDVGLLREESRLNGVNVFGYGVRGKDNFKIAFKLAQDLGYKKVCCIIDGGTDENAVKADLESSFSETGYKVVQWEKADIRDKSVYSTTEKEGYFTNRGIKKSPDQLADFETKLTEIIQYLS